MVKKRSVEVRGESGHTYWMDESNRLHRDDGPAVERPSGNNSWYVRDRRVTEEEFIVYQKEQRMKKALGLV